jgi:capsular polysaccharide transport system ATP-binding protein
MPKHKEKRRHARGLEAAPAMIERKPPEASGKHVTVSDLVKTYETAIGPKRVLDGISFTVGQGEKIGVLGRNGSGKSTLVKLIGGVERFTSGSITRGMSLSWPIAFGGGFGVSMSGFDNIRFIARVYDKPIDDVIAYVDDFAELGRDLYRPVQQYSSGMRARLAFALMLAIDFECFLIDEVISVGDQSFQKKSHYELFEKRGHCAMILVSHDHEMIKRYCNRALILKNGRGRVFEDVEYALSIYSTL